MDKEIIVLGNGVECEVRPYSFSASNTVADILLEKPELMPMFKKEGGDTFVVDPEMIDTYFTDLDWYRVFKKILFRSQERMEPIFDQGKQVGERKTRSIDYEDDYLSLDREVAEPIKKKLKEKLPYAEIAKRCTAYSANRFTSSLTELIEGIKEKIQKESPQTMLSM